VKRSILGTALVLEIACSSNTTGLPADAGREAGNDASGGSVVDAAGSDAASSDGAAESDANHGDVDSGGADGASGEACAGLVTDTKIASLSNDALRALCDCGAQRGGGYGQMLTAMCDGGFTGTKDFPKNAAACIAFLTQGMSACATEGDFLTFATSDACASDGVLAVLRILGHCGGPADGGPDG
jgi:hypothetical protein